MSTLPPDPKTLTGYTAKAQSEIAQHLFAATTGGLVSLSAPTFWEMYYAARAWHDHLRAQEPENQRLQEEAEILQVQGADALLAHREQQRAAAGAPQSPDQQSATAT